MLVVANETVVGEALLDRIRERAGGRRRASCSSARRATRGRPRTRRRSAGCARALADAALRGHRRPRPGDASRPVHGGAAGDRRRAGGRGASSRRSRASARAGCAATWSSGCARTRACRSSTSWSRPRARRRWPRERARRSAITARRSRIRARGSTRRRSGCCSSSRRRSWSSGRSSRPTSSSASSTTTRGRRDGDRAAGLRRRRQHGDPRDLELHDALGHPVDQARQPRRPAGRAWC